MQVEDTADFALKLFATVDKLRKDRKAGEAFRHWTLNIGLRNAEREKDDRCHFTPYPSLYLSLSLSSSSDCISLGCFEHGGVRFWVVKATIDDLRRQELQRRKQQSDFIATATGTTTQLHHFPIQHPNALRSGFCRDEEDCGLLLTHSVDFSFIVTKN